MTTDGVITHCRWTVRQSVVQLLKPTAVCRRWRRCCCSALAWKLADNYSGIRARNNPDTRRLIDGQDAKMREEELSEVWVVASDDNGCCPSVGYIMSQKTAIAVHLAFERRSWRTSIRLSQHGPASL